MANKKDREQPVIYRAWVPSLGQNVDKAGKWGAISVEAAAVLEAKMNWREGLEQMLVMVAEPRSDGRTFIYQVVVDVAHRPEFEAHRAILLVQEGAR